VRLWVFYVLGSNTSRRGQSCVGPFTGRKAEAQTAKVLCTSWRPHSWGAAGPDIKVGTTSTTSPTSAEPAHRWRLCPAKVTAQAVPIQTPVLVSALT
jgi:hypothetical protein